MNNPTSFKLIFKTKNVRCAKKCINCSACSQFAPETFRRSTTTSHHVVYHQPTIPLLPLEDSDAEDSIAAAAVEFQNARAAMAACPVSAIRTSSVATRTNSKDESIENDHQLISKQRELSKAYALNPKVNKLPLPFPKQLTLHKQHHTISNTSTTKPKQSIWYLGHHCKDSFGAMPYLLQGQDSNDNTIHIMVDVPKCTPTAVRTVQSLLPPHKQRTGPDYMILTHVDDTAHHEKWVDEKVFPKMKRIFHVGDLEEKYNWIGDDGLNDVEILLTERSRVEDGELIGWSLGSSSSADEEGSVKVVHLDTTKHDRNGNIEQRTVSSFCSDTVDFGKNEYLGDFLILHTPGHTPGSISLLFKASSPAAATEVPDGHRRHHRHGTIFTGDTIAYTTRNGGHLTGFPQYAKEDRLKQADTLRCLERISSLWDCIAPGHGHIRDYTMVDGGECTSRSISSDGACLSSYQPLSSMEEMKRKEFEYAIKELANYNRKGAYL